MLATPTFPKIAVRAAKAAEASAQGSQEGSQDIDVGMVPHSSFTPTLFTIGSKRAFHDKAFLSFR
jgi:hypothetical protein